MQDGITGGYAFAQFFHPGPGHARIRDKRKNIEEKPFLVTDVECISGFYIERVQVAYLDDRLFVQRVAFRGLQE